MEVENRKLNDIKENYQHSKRELFFPVNQFFITSLRACRRQAWQSMKASLIKEKVFVYPKTTILIFYDNLLKYKNYEKSC